MKRRHFRWTQLSNFGIHNLAFTGAGLAFRVLPREFAEAVAEYVPSSGVNGAYFKKQRLRSGKG